MTQFNRCRLALPKATVLALLTSTLASVSQAQTESGYSLLLEEVIVTAQQREESSMKTPVTVNAFSALDIVNVGALDIQDMDDFMPGVEIGDGNTTQTGISIRGVESPNISSGGDPSTATFYDGAYLPRAATTIPFSDIERIEVLKGPQGTLFGRNATAGVINIIPNAPVDEWQGSIQGRAGNFGFLRFEGMLNAPLSDSIAIRLNLMSSSRDGTVDNVGVGPDPGDEGVTAARISALWDVSDATSLQFSADLEDRDEAPRTAIGVGARAFNQSDDPFSGQTAHDVVGAEETREMQGYSIKLNHDFSDAWSVYAISSFRDWETTNLEEEDGTADPRVYLDTNNIEESDIFYNEVRFNFVSDNIDLILGANYSKEDLFQRTDLHLTGDSWMQFVTILGGFGADTHLWDLLGDDEDAYLGFSQAFGLAVIPPSFAGQLQTETMDNTGDFTNWGVFADATYQLTDTVRIAAGLRYSKDKKTYTWQTYETDLDWPFPPQRVAYDPAVIDDDPSNDFDQYSRSDSWNKVTGRLVADWQFSDDAMTYLSVATGYKSGGFDGQVFTPVLTGAFAPEEMLSVEWGLKGDFFDKRVRIEAALFMQELDNRQRSVDVKDGPDDPTAQPSVISGDDETQGIELIATWTVTDSLRIAALSTYRETDSIFERYFDSAGQPAGGIEESTRADTDYTLRFDWTPTISVGHLLVHVDYVYDENNEEPDVIYATGPWYLQNKKLLSARIAWKNEADNIEVALWGRNLLDNEYAGNPGGFVADTLGAAHTELDDPLTWGIDARYSF
ncbi:MAG: TonB-dependent receptor [Pseudomonadales bacterium]